MAQQENAIHIVAINKWFRWPENVVAEVKKEIVNFKGVPVIFLFPEAILGKSAIARESGKWLAKKLHEVCREHGQAYCVYSVFEQRIRGTKGLEKRPLITNTGYFVLPATNEKSAGYTAYPKISTYGGGKGLTLLDEYVFQRNAPNFRQAVENNYSLVKKIKSFPAFNIGGLKVEMRVCSDLMEEPNVDAHQARKGMDKKHLILVPAAALPLNSGDIEHLGKHLTPDGLALILDRVSGSLFSIHRENDSLAVRNLAKEKKVEHGRFRITHRV